MTAGITDQARARGGLWFAQKGFAMIDSNSLRQMECLLLDLLPGDCPENVYILSPEEAGERFCMNYSAAFTGAGCDLRLKPRLQEIGLWRGPGFAMVIQATDHFAWMTTMDRLGIVLHEFGHHLWYEPLRPELAERESELTGKPFYDSDFMPEKFKTQEERDIDASLARDAYPYAEHGMQFTRICLHLRHRCMVNSYDVAAERLFIAGPRYHLSPVADYLAALGDEPQRRSSERIVDIAESDPPEAFSSLFFEDIRRYLEPKIRAELMAKLNADPTAIPQLAALLESIIQGSQA